MIMSVNLTEWARTQGVRPRTAYRWFRAGTLVLTSFRARRHGRRAAGNYARTALAAAEHG